MEMPSVFLSVVYFVRADRTYHGQKGVDRSRTGYVVIRTLRGTGILRLKDSPPLVLKEQSLIMVEYWKVIDYQPQADSWDFWWFEFGLSGLAMLPLGQPTIIPETSPEPSCRDQCMLLLRKPSAAARMAASAYMGLLLSHWMQNLGHEKTYLYGDRISALVHYLHQHTGEDITVEQMASLCGLSVRRFRDVFTRVMQCTPRQYVTRMKMERADFLLCNTAFSISEIAQSLGYPDPFYFSRVFSQQYGLPPQQYRLRYTYGAEEAGNGQAGAQIGE